MSQELRIIPENLVVANLYLEHNDIDHVAALLNSSSELIVATLGKKDVRDYITQVYLDTGYRNRFKLATVLDKLIDQKMEEAEDTGFYTKADILDLMKFAHQLRMDEAKMNIPNQQTNVQINEFGEGNYGELMKRLIG
tara:strand:+ start:29078 stop:29491 length:414 start_codon:yes stop_codon:yes gene_type:complete